MATLLLVIIYAAFIGLGLPDSLLGAAWPLAHADLGVPISVAGAVNVVTAVGTVVSSLLSARLIRRFGTATVTAASILMSAIALFGMGFAGRFGTVLLLAVPLGFAAGTVDSALNNFVALHYRANHMNWLHCFWGVGATAGPAIMALYLTKNNWHGAYRTVSLALFGIAALVLASFPLWKRMTASAQQAVDGQPASGRALLALPGVVTACLSFFAYCGAEYAAGLWASSYLVRVRGVAADTAAGWAALYYLGITVGRFVSGFAALRLSGRTLVRLGVAIALMGVLALLFMDGTAQAGALFLVGLGCAPIFPSMLEQTPKLFGAANSQGIMGLQFAAAYLGGTLLCPLFGWLSPLIGLGAWPAYLLALFLLLAFFTEYTQRRACVHLSKNIGE